MKIAFLSELPFQGLVQDDYPNMRTEFAWMYALQADHFNISLYEYVKNYDHVFIIFPKGELNYNTVGVKIGTKTNTISALLATNWLQMLKANNKKIHYVQEGPSWIFTELEIFDQISIYNMLVEVDSIFAHNSHDAKFYRGLVHPNPVYVMPTLMIDDLVKNVKPEANSKVIVGGNFARWYGGFQSYIVAREFNIPIWTQTSHAMRAGEEQLVQHLPRVSWVDWIKQLSSFKYAVHLMPTIAAGTFSLNCAYLGIPCIGNEQVDTQLICHPNLAVDVDDVETARKYALKLKEDEDFYIECSKTASELYKEHYSKECYLNKLNHILTNII